MKDLLEIKTGELYTKTEELKETNESLYILSNEIRTKTEEIKNTKKDLTEIEESLIAANDKLAENTQKFAITNKELASVNKELVTSNEQIKQLALKQKEFIEITAHELRTPTQAILGYSEMMISNPSVNMEYPKRIMRNASRLQKLVSNILDMAKIDNNEFSLDKKPFNLDDLIITIVEDIQSQVSQDKENLSIHYNTASIIKRGKEKEDIKIVADKDRITQVITNLLDNAIRFTEKGTIVITISRDDIYKDNGNRNYLKEIIVKVKDSGKGLDPQLYSKVFSKFFSSSESGSTGLDLYICKAIIEAHGGKIWVETNEDEKGTTFSFSLPLKN